MNSSRFTFAEGTRMQRPKDLPIQDGLVNILVEFYGVGVFWGMDDTRYLRLANVRGQDGSSGGAGIAAPNKSETLHSCVFSEAEMEVFQRELAAITIPLVEPVTIFAQDGWKGAIHVAAGNYKTQISWHGNSPDAWEPLYDWLGSVEKRIVEKAALEIP